MEFEGVYLIMVFFVVFCKLEVPKMWENSPVIFSHVLQSSAFFILFPTFEVKSLVFIIGVKIVKMCCNNRQPYLHVRYHDQFVMWYQNSCTVKGDGFFGRGGGHRLARVGYCGAVNTGHDEDLQMWL
jgi:hypothetical protein